MSDFHWRDGWTFNREPNGSVELTKRIPIQERSVRSGADELDLRYRGHKSDLTLPLGDGEYGVSGPFVVTERLVIPAAEWASIIASVSAFGETSETYRDATAFHGGRT